MKPDPAAFQAQMHETGQGFWARPDRSLLASMTEAKIPWPVSCRNGTCRTCIGRLIQGQVIYDIPWPGLSAEEKREGYCLPCVARPLSDLVLTAVKPFR